MRRSLRDRCLKKAAARRSSAWRRLDQSAFIRSLILKGGLSRRICGFYDSELRRASCVSEALDALGKTSHNPQITQIQMPDLSLVPPAFGYVIAGVFGAIIGSFLNVVIHRLPSKSRLFFQTHVVRRAVQ